MKRAGGARKGRVMPVFGRSLEVPTHTSPLGDLAIWGGPDMLHTLLLSVERLNVANETVEALQRLVLPQSEGVYPKGTGYAPRPGGSLSRTSAIRTR